MPFSESLKLNVRRKAHFACCLCKSLGVEVHHIEPQQDDGPDTEDNAAPLCPSCHEIYGANPQKRKFIREARDLWYEICEKRFASDPQRLDDLQRMLENIESQVRSSNDPLLPFGLFYTLRHTTTSDAIERAFKGVRGFKSLNSDILQLVGTARLGGHGIYNSIEIRPKESHAALDKQALEALIEDHSGFGETVIKALDTTVEFFFSGPGSVPDKASLVFEGAFEDGKPREVRRLELFDDVIFQDTFVKRWEVTNPSRRAWSVTDLHRARVRLTMRMLSFNKINFEKPPLLHNLHMFFGRTTPQILFFTAEQLENPGVVEESDPPIQWDFSAVGMDVRPLLISYEFDIHDELFFNQLKQVV